jgi:Restriction Enzyme Adenine Methylase Associated
VFTGSDVPAIVNPVPRLILLAGSFHGRTESAVDFLIENRLPVKVVPVTIYEDQQGRRFVDIEMEHEPEFTSVEQVEVIDHTKIEGRRVRITDLLDAGLLVPGDTLRWTRPQLGQQYEATVTELGTITVSDGRTFSSPSRAAMDVADVAAYDGWHAWRVERLEGKTLDDLRRELATSARQTA